MEKNMQSDPFETLDRTSVHTDLRCYSKFSGTRLSSCSLLIFFYLTNPNASVLSFFVGKLWVIPSRCFFAHEFMIAYLMLV